jgi:hypothetical protein
MAKKKKATRNAAKAAPAGRRVSDASKGSMSAVMRLATHPENVIATLNAHAAPLEMLIAQIHVLAVGGPGVQAMRAAKETLRRLLALRVPETMQRPAGRSSAEYEISATLAKAEVRDILNGAIDQLGRQARGAM